MNAKKPLNRAAFSLGSVFGESSGKPEKNKTPVEHTGVFLANEIRNRE